MKTVIPAAILLALLVALVKLVGLSIIVIQPLGVLPDGVTVVVVGIKNTNFIDSPDAICARNEGGVSLLCRAREGAAVADHGTILLRLPYSEMLFRLTGAP